jgi:mannosyltransferase
VSTHAAPLAPEDPGRAIRSYSGTLKVLAIVALCIEIPIALFLRFGVALPMWLDEALTVNIARLPLSAIPGALRRDGAPPLYYVLLHFWMQIVGTSVTSVRALSGVFSVAALVVTWWVVRRIFDAETSWVTVALLAGSPFAVYYATEARMYSLLALEAVLCLWALNCVLARGQWSAVVALGVVVGSMLSTHYWSIYFLASLGIWLVVRASLRRGAERRLTLHALAGFALGGLLFLPWVPTFLYQAAHTGTPWGQVPPATIISDTIVHFTENQAALHQIASLHSALLSGSYLVLCGLGIVGLAVGRFVTALDWRTRTRSRVVAIATFGTLVLGSAAAWLSGNVVTQRYASAAFIPLLIVIALGIGTFGDAWLRFLLTLAVAGASLWAAEEYRTTARTQSVQVAKQLAIHGAPGDVVAFCPDQLGPSTMRLVPAGRYRTVTYPLGSSAELINWVDYERRIAHQSGVTFAHGLLRLAGNHHIFVVWQPYAWGLHGRCGQIVTTLSTTPKVTTKPLVSVNDARYFQPMAMWEFIPPGTK